MIELGIFDVVVANKHYNHLESDYEIIVHNDTKFFCAITEQTIPANPAFNFRKIKELVSLELNSLYGE